MKFLNTNKNTPLKIIKFGGSESATKNLLVYEYDNDIVVFDCGVGLPDSEMHGVDVIIPDFTYLIENQDRIRGLIVTHAHEDHFGAVPYLLSEIDIPVYATPLVQELVKIRVKDRAKDPNLTIRFTTVSQDTKDIKLGSHFNLSAFRVNHSVPNALGFALDTPEGKIIHMADFKVDFAPVLDKPIDLQKLAKISEEGVLCLLSDCLGATTDGYTETERSLDRLFPELFERGEGRQIMVTTISSNISRMRQITDAAVAAGRKVVPAGRSVDQSIKIARSLGYLPHDDSVFISEREAENYNEKDKVYIIAGCYGQNGSGLDRVARDEHRRIKLEENALVIFSADPNPPGVQLDVERLLNNLTVRKAEVIYNKIQDNLHVSGHGAKGDLSIVAGIVQPKYFIPIGGEPTKMRAYKNLMGTLGFDEETVFELVEGESVEIKDQKAKKGTTYELKTVYVDGTKNLGEIVIRDREQLANDGVFVVIIPLEKSTNLPIAKSDIVTRGFVYVKESKELMGYARDKVNKTIDKFSDGQKLGKLQDDIEKSISRYLSKETGRRPMVIVHFVKV